MNGGSGGVVVVALVCGTDLNITCNKYSDKVFL